MVKHGFSQHKNANPATTNIDSSTVITYYLLLGLSLGYMTHMQNYYTPWQHLIGYTMTANNLLWTIQSVAYTSMVQDQNTPRPVSQLKKL